MERILSYQDALSAVLNKAREISPPGTTEPLPLLAARGRALAQPLLADRDQPPFARSTRDGFAVRSSDVSGSGDILRLLGSLRAGEQWNGPPLQPGEAIEIMTGAPVPAGADAVLMVEHATVSDDGTLRPAADRRLRALENVVPTAAEARAGATLIPAGRRVGTPEISLAASCGCSTLQVYAKPHVVIIATGDELVELDEPPQPWQIHNSNSYSLAALVETEGGIAYRLPIARDTSEDLRARLAESVSADLLLFSGGVSKGKYDLVEAVLREAGAEFFFTGALIQPGKPVVFGRLPRRTPTSDASAGNSGSWTPFFGLPGNPISTEVCFRLFVAPLLRALAGHTELAPRFAEATLAEDIPAGAHVTRFLPAAVESAWDGVTVRLVPWQGSGDLAANARANGFVVLPVDAPAFTAGDRVRVLLR